MRAGSYILRPRLIALDLACEPLNRAFEFGVYLVGSALERADFRDVDVRVLLTRAEWDGMFPGVDPAQPFLDPRWELLCLTMSEHLSRASGLPIDFQYQEVKTANEVHHSGKRSALGIRMVHMRTRTQWEE